MESQSVFRRMIKGIGVAILSLLAGTVLDYIITQVVSQFFLAACSEDCYFRIFNAIFVVVVIVSIVAGLRAGLRSNKN